MRRAGWSRAGVFAGPAEIDERHGAHTAAALVRIAKATLHRPA
jgi:hypothetical protein